MTAERTDLLLTCGKVGTDGSLIVNIRVQPRSSRLAIGAVENGRLKLRLTAPPIDGKANTQAAKLLAKAFGAASSRVELIRGRTSRDKSFRITGSVRIPSIMGIRRNHTDS